MSASISAANSTTAASSTAASDQSAALPALPSKALNQQDFLKLLVAQLTSQDPLNPVSNTDFAAQMAQFSSLQAAQSTEASVASLQSSQQFSQANSLLGETVTVQTATDASGATIATAQGTVTGIQIQSGAPQIIVNGQPYGLSQVITVNQN